MNNNKGVTIVALVITVLVILIIAGVSVVFLVGDNGVLTRATEMEERFSKTEIEELFGMKINEILIIGYERAQETGENIDDLYNEQEVLKYLQDEQYIVTDISSGTVKSLVDGGDDIYLLYYVKPSKISTRVQKYGRGESIETGDVYVLTVNVEDIKDEEGNPTGEKKSTGQYEFKYCDINGEEELLATYDFLATKPKEQN